MLQFGLDAVVEENRTTPAAVGGPVSLLQFGLDAVVEENDAAPAEDDPQDGLQFGLDAVVEENETPTLILEPAPACFNSASTLSSRRTWPPTD